MKDHVAIIELGEGGVYEQKDAHIYAFPNFDKEEILFTIRDLEEHYDEVYLSHTIKTKDLKFLGLEKFYGNT